MTSSYLLPFSLGMFIALVLVLPLVRQRVRTGIWAVVVRDSSTSVESFVRGWTVVLLAAVAAWAVLVPMVGNATLGVWDAPRAFAWIGVGFMALGFAIAIAAQAHMGASWRIGIDDAPTGLVTHGSFRWVRHPIYTGILSMFAGIAWLTPSAWSLSALVVAYILIAVQSRLEEEHMAAQHGAAFRDWAARTGRFVPGIGRRGDGHRGGA